MKNASNRAKPFHALSPSSLWLTGLCLWGLVTSSGMALAQMPDPQPSDPPLEEPPPIEEPQPENSPVPEIPGEQPSFNAPFSQQSFVPDIALILDLGYVWRNMEDASYQALRKPFQTSNGLSGGYGLNYAELSLSSAVDPFFDLTSIFHLGIDHFEIEEAYFTTRALPWNLQLKAGKFLSQIGRLNNQHEHVWAFTDQPLIYSAILGPENLNEIGAQINWLAPTDFYLNLGLEALKGDNEASFGTQGITRGTTSLPAVTLPNLLVASAKTSVDLDPLVVLGGLSFATGGTRFPGLGTGAAETDPTALPFAGATRIYGADLTVKYPIDSYQELIWQSEFLHRSLGGNTYDDKGQTQAFSREQNGLYSQLVWRFNQQWRTGLRLDLLLANQGLFNGAALDLQSFLPRYTAMLEFNPTEFSRIRLQVEHDRSRLAEADLAPVTEVFLQFNLAMGAHGAHPF